MHIKEIYYKELAQTIMETEGSQNLQSNGQRTRRANGISSSLRQERPMSQLGGHQAESSFSLAQPFDLLLVPLTGLPVLGRAICFIHSVDSKVNLI